MTEVAILVPVLRRPQNVRPLLESIAATTRGAHVVFITEAGDVEEQQAVRREAANYARSGEVAVTELVRHGNYARKINEAVPLTDEPYVFLAADDLKFHRNWLGAAVAKMSDRIGVVGTNDLCNRRVMRGEHSTHSLVARWYTSLGTIDNPDCLLHEGYPHEFVDDEFVQTAIRREAFAHARNSVVEHLHPQVGKAPMDDLYQGQALRMRRGRRIYLRRRELWT